MSKICLKSVLVENVPKIWPPPIDAPLTTNDPPIESKLSKKRFRIWEEGGWTKDDLKRDFIFIYNYASFTLNANFDQF